MTAYGGGLRVSELVHLHQRATSALEEKGKQIQLLAAEIERLADPELMAIYKEDERERLRIEREYMERARKSQQQAADAARKSAQQSSKLLDDFVRKELGLD